MEILIADHEIQIKEMLSFYLHDNYEPITKIYHAQNKIEANDVLSNHLIDFVFCSHALLDGLGSDVSSFIQKRDLATRFILMSDQKFESISHYYDQSKIFYFFEKKEIINDFDNFLKKCESDSVVLSKINYTTSYSPVTLDFLLVLSRIPSDVFIKLSDTKYLKCLSIGDMFLEVDKAKYQDKKIEHLYIKLDEDNKEQIKQAMSSAIGKVFNNTKSPLQDKISVAHSQVVGMVKLNGMTPEMADITKYTVSKSAELITKIDILNDFWKKINLMGEYPSKLYTLQSMLCSLILKELKWNSEATFFKLSLAAFLQDVTLANINLIKIKDYNEFLAKKNILTQEEVKNFLDHPFKVKDVIDVLREIPPDIDRIVLEQHELPNGDGFPRKLNALQLSPLSCIFILSGITSKTMLEQGADFNPESFIEKMDAGGYSKGNFRDSFKILKKILVN